MAIVYCGSCGAALNDTAKFCRACGSGQGTFATPVGGIEPTEVAELDVGAAPTTPSLPPLSPPPVAAKRAKRAQQPGFAAPPPPPGPPPPALAPARTGGVTAVAATLALVGGIGICLLAVYSLVFLPLKHGLSYTYDEPPRLLDVLTLASGLLATALGADLLRRPLANRGAIGAVLLALAIPALALTIVTLYPDSFHIDFFSRPPYVDYDYFAFVLNVDVSDHYLPVPLLASLGLVVLGGITMLAPPRQSTPAPGRR
jgi:hypothetical protein